MHSFEMQYFMIELLTAGYISNNDLLYITINSIRWCSVDIEEKYTLFNLFLIFQK